MWRLANGVAPAADHIIAVVERRQQAWYVMRLGLRVGVERDDTLAARAGEAGRQCRRAAKGAPQTDDP